MIDYEQLEGLSIDYNVIPVVKKLFSGSETPIGLYQKLAGARADTSAGGGGGGGEGEEAATEGGEGGEAGEAGEGGDRWL